MHRDILIEALTSFDMSAKSCTSDVCLGFVSCLGKTERHGADPERSLLKSNIRRDFYEEGARPIDQISALGP